MPSMDKKLLALLCTLSLPVHSASEEKVLNELVVGNNDVLQAPAEMNRLVEQSLFLEVDSFAQRQILVGEYGRIIVREDNKSPWLQANVPVQTTITAIEFVNDKLAWAVGHQGVILKTTDGGRNWTKMFDGVQLTALLKASLEAQVATLTAEFEQAETADIDEDSLDDLEMLLDDVTYKLEDLTASAGIEISFFDVLFTSPDYGLVIGAYGAMLETKDGGNSWHYIGHKVPNPEGFHLNALTKDAANNIYVVGEAGIGMATSDSGETWRPLEIDYFGSLFGIEVKGDALYSYGLRGNMFMSQDKGYNWQPLNTGVTNHIFSADWLNNKELLLVGAGGLKLVYNGHSFNNISKTNQRVDITSVKVINDNVITTGLRGWQGDEKAKLVQGGLK